MSDLNARAAFARSYYEYCLRHEDLLSGFCKIFLIAIEHRIESLTKDEYQTLAELAYRVSYKVHKFTHQD